MIRTLVGVLGSLFRFVVVAVVLTVLASVAVTTGAVDVGLDDGDRVETPDPLPDWPFVWEVPVGIDPGTDPGIEPELDPDGDVDSGDDREFDDPVREDPGTTTVGHGDGTVTSDEIGEAVHERINAIRVDNDLPTVDHDDRLAGISRVHSHDMGEREYFSHVSPEGETPADRADELFPDECRGIGENLAYVTTIGGDDADAIAERVVDGWMDSDPHRENILTERWDSHGIGVYVVDDRVFVTQKFCEQR